MITSVYNVQSSPVQSVIISTYNRKEMLAGTISSVLNQTQKNLELIIIDDTSSDGTEEYVKSLQDSRIRYFRNEKNMGPESNRNKGFKYSRGKYITFIDDDDYYTDYEFFSKAIKIFEEHDSNDAPLSFVSANAMRLYVDSGRQKPSNIGTPGRVKGIDYILDPQYEKPLSTFPTVFSADMLRKAGFYDKKIDDTPTYLELAVIGDAWFMPDIIGVYRDNPVSMTRGHYDNPALEARHYDFVRYNARSWRLVKDKLHGKADEKKITQWYINGASMHMYYFAIARPSIKDRLKVIMIILQESGFMPVLWIKIIFTMLKMSLQRITPLRKLYRFIKYRLRGKPYPEEY